MGRTKGGSGRWGDRPLVGIGGDGGAATRGTGPESTVIVPVVGGAVDSQLGSIVSVPSYLAWNSTRVRPATPTRFAPIDSVVIAAAFSLECGPCQPNLLRFPSARDLSRLCRLSA